MATASNYRDLCRTCGGTGSGGGPARCACGEPAMPSGRAEDIETLANCGEATNLECVAPATLTGSDKSIGAVLAVEPNGSLVVLRTAGRHGVIDPGELLSPDYEVEISKRFTLELSRGDAESFREELEEAGWSVGEGRERRRNDLLDEMASLDAAWEATGLECVSTAGYAEEEGGDTLADTIVVRDADGSLRLLDENGYEELEPMDGMTVLLPQHADEGTAAGLTEAGYDIPRPRMTLVLPSGKEFTCELPHLRGGTATGRYAGMSAKCAMLAALAEFGPLACFEMSGITGLRHRTLSGRIADLQFDGLIRESSVSRPCPVTGGSQHVYELGCDPARVGVRDAGRTPSKPSAYNGEGRSRLVVDYLKECGQNGATTSEITAGLGGDENGIVEHAVSATTSNLVKLDVIHITGKRLSALTGRPQSVFAAA